MLAVSAASFRGARLDVDAAQIFEDLVYIDMPFGLVFGIRALNM
jgi:hypothetical protein